MTQSAIAKGGGVCCMFAADTAVRVLLLIAGVFFMSTVRVSLAQLALALPWHASTCRGG
jgi:hypothetical protein